MKEFFIMGQKGGGKKLSPQKMERGEGIFERKIFVRRKEPSGVRNRVVL